eukprot:scaffold3017_cov229-Prasinococcus_capsulatus_cf.AAC.1
MHVLRHTDAATTDALSVRSPTTRLYTLSSMTSPVGRSRTHCCALVSTSCDTQHMKRPVDSLGWRNQPAGLLVSRSLSQHPGMSDG